MCVLKFIWPRWVLAAAHCMLSASRDLSLRLMDALVVVCGLNCSEACGVLISQPGMDPASPALQGGFLITSEVPTVCSEVTAPADETNLSI